MKIRASGLALGACAALSLGCQFLLPRQRTEVESTWERFEDARAAFDAIEVGRTTRAELASLGFDPYSNANVDIETYVDVFAHFVPNDATKLAEQDPGVQECVAARSGCVALRVDTFRESAREHGSFWLNLFLIREQTEVVGWVFEALVLVVDDRVVYKLWEGNPRVVKRQDKIRPLGPLQDIDVSVKIEFP